MNVVPLHPLKAEPPGPDDAQLVRRALDGDRAASELLYRRYAPELYDTLVRLLRNESDAQDVLHDAFVVALDRLDQLEDPTRFRAWVLRTAIRFFYRKERRRKWLSVFVARPYAIDLAPVASPEVRAEVELLFAALADVPVKARAAWSLRYVEGHSLAETAAACGCSLATVKRRIAAAQQVLGQHIDLEAAP